MGWRVWFWIAVLLSAGTYITLTALAAFSVPWSWNIDQLSATFFAACIIAPLISWGVLWMREGNAAVRARAAAFKTELTNYRFSTRRSLWNIAFWVVIALLLVAYFNFKQSS